MIPAVLFTAYFTFGSLFAIPFVTRGIDRIDAAPKSVGFRLIALPAATVLWPFLLGRWIGAGL